MNQPIGRMVSSTYVDGRLVVVYDFGYASITSIPIIAGAKPDHRGIVYPENVVQQMANDLAAQIEARDKEIAANPEPAEVVKDVAETCTHDHPSEIYAGRKPPENRAHRRRAQKKLAKERQYYASGFEV